LEGLVSTVDHDEQRFVDSFGVEVEQAEEPVVAATGAVGP
jgi:hypothetical protein